MNAQLLSQSKTSATSAPPMHSNFLQRKCACGGTPGPTSECEECRKKRLQRATNHQSALNSEPSVVPPIVNEVLRSPGEPLDAATRAFMERRFAHDFSHVRVHMDAKAAESARAVNARAYTVGRDVVFGAVDYTLHPRDDVRLIAHELAHTLQKPTFATRPSASLTISSPDDAAEQEADRAADAVVAGLAASTDVAARVSSSAATSASLFRQPKAPSSKAPAHLRACDAKTEIPTINKAVAQAKQSATDAVQGLQELLNIWGKVPSTIPQKAAARALASGFNIEFDKTDWVALGIATAAEVKTLDKRDHAAVSTLLTNFKKIEADLPNYAGAPGCNLSTGKLDLTSPCFGCADAEYARCKESPLSPGAIAFVLATGVPSSPMFFCPAFFKRGDMDQSDFVLHEAAHVQDFAASDIIGSARYYGCPVMPLEPLEPGLREPSEFIHIADSYRCFVLTQRETAAAFKQIQKIEQEAKKITP